MARVSVYVPDELVARARATGVNISVVTEQALRAVLAADGGDQRSSGEGAVISPELVSAALDELSDELDA